MHRPFHLSIRRDEDPNSVPAKPGAPRRSRALLALAVLALIHAGNHVSVRAEEVGAGSDPSPFPSRNGGLVIPEEDEGAPETVIQGDRLEMVANEEEARFVFTDNIRVTGNNIVLTCDRLEVVSSRQDGERESSERLAGMGRIRRIVASGRVHVTQEGREATAGRAEVLPDEGRVILTESPVIRDSQGEVSGERILLYQGLERAVVESSEERPARVTLPDLPDLGFRPGETGAESE